MYEKIIRIFKQGCRQVQKHGRNVKKTSRKDGSQCSTVVTGQSSNPSCSQDKSDIQDTIPRSVHYTISHQTQNWLKAVLALRIAREYVSPVLDEFVQDMHQELVQKHGRNVSLNQIAQFRENGEVPSLLRAWINDVRSFHRTPPSTGAIRRITDVTKWPTSEGAWEIARGFRTGSENDSASFDVSAVFNYIYRCRKFEGQIEDINIARNILKARNMAMHSPMSEFTEPQLQTCLDVVDSLFNDETLKSCALKFPQTADTCNSFAELKRCKLNFIDDTNSAFQFILHEFQIPTNKSETNYNTQDIETALQRIFSSPRDQIAQEIVDIGTSLTTLADDNRRFKLDANDHIGRLESQVDRLNNQVNILQSYVFTNGSPLINGSPLTNGSQSTNVSTLTNESPSTSTAQRTSRKPQKRKRRKPFHPTPSGQLIYQDIHPIRIYDHTVPKHQAWMTTDILQSPRPLRYAARHSSSCPSLFSPNLTSPTKSNPTLPSPTSASPISSYPTINSPTPSYHTLCSPTRSSPTHFSPIIPNPISSYPTINSPTPSYHTLCSPTQSSPTQSSPTLPNPIQPYPTINSPTPSYLTLCSPAQSSPTLSSPCCSNSAGGMKRKSSYDTRELELKKRKSDSYSNTSIEGSVESALEDPGECRKKAGSGGGGNPTKYQDLLKRYLLSQEGNIGPTYQVRVDEHNKFHSEVTFMSNFAISTDQPQPSAHEAKCKAAAEAMVWLGMKNAKSIRSPIELFNAYCEVMQREKPSYHTFQVSQLYVTFMQFYNNYSVAQPDGVNGQKVYLQVKCSSSTCKSANNIEDMAACTALTDANVFPHPNMTAVKQQLNEHCLQHGATLPLYYTTITQNVLNNNEIYKCAVRSYIRSALSDSSHPSYCNGPDDLPTQLDERVFYADIVEAECKPQRTRDMSVEAAAKLMLEKLGVEAEKPCCDENTYMSQLEDYAAEWGYTAVYHTTEIVPDADIPTMYDCVVSSECLRDTNQSFVVCSNIRGTFTMDEANESAALNAARLLGIQQKA